MTAIELLQIMHEQYLRKDADIPAGVALEDGRTIRWHVEAILERAKSGEKSDGSKAN